MVLPWEDTQYTSIHSVLGLPQYTSSVPDPSTSTTNISFSLPSCVMDRIIPTLLPVALNQRFRGVDEYVPRLSPIQGFLPFPGSPPKQGLSSSPSSRLLPGTYTKTACLMYWEEPRRREKKVQSLVIRYLWASAPPPATRVEMLPREPKRVLKELGPPSDLPGFRWPSADGMWESSSFSEQTEPQWGETAQVRLDSAPSAPGSAS